MFSLLIQRIEAEHFALAQKLNREREERDKCEQEQLNADILQIEKDKMAKDEELENQLQVNIYIYIT